MAFLDQLSIPSSYTAISEEHIRIGLAAGLILAFVSLVFILYLLINKTVINNVLNEGRQWLRFFYVSFLKPHNGDAGNSQQGALESFYKAQADAYDTTRKRLLRGREEMLALVAAQLKYQYGNTPKPHNKPVWIDVGGGTGWNIEAMSQFLDVPKFFCEVYIVDYSPSLCEVARKRFTRLGWNNVQVICEDAKVFNLGKRKAELITMSYSLSMLPNFHVFIDHLASLLDPRGVIGVVDFYVQSGVEAAGRNYIGGTLQRHVNWLGRTFWRAWFDLDRVGLEGARRDYLEYRFGTLKTIDERNYILGCYSGISIPYYIFLGRLISSNSARAHVERLDAACTESPYLMPREASIKAQPEIDIEIRSKAYRSALINLSANLPLPSTFYQNYPYRIYYEEQHQKHLQFGNSFIYAFTWEDSRIDQRLLKIKEDDVILCLTSAGDNLLDYLTSCNPRRIHAVDLNPNQSHLLELKVAAYQAVEYVDFWRMFGEGRLPGFRRVLLEQMSPYLSSQALQFWLNQENIFSSNYGLYEYGGSGHAMRLVRRLFTFLGLRGTVKQFIAAKTLNEQRELWPKIKSVLLNKFLHSMFIGAQFLWKAAGVPAAQAAMITRDYVNQDLDTSKEPTSKDEAEAMWQYITNTLEPVARDTLISDDNFYYLLTLHGKYTRRCHPPYLSAKAHARLSKPGAFDGLRIHTDEINEVIAKIRAGTLSIAIIMDSMDWFNPQGPEAAIQIAALNRALKLGGRVLLRSAGLRPWYTPVFERFGFDARRAAARLPGTCIDRVNMYASTWIMTKTHDLSVNNDTPLAKLSI